MSLVLYGWAASRTRRCLWTLEEVGAEFTFRHIDGAAGEHRTSKYLKLNPNGSVPTLVDGDLVLFESVAICNHIARKHPEHGLIPDEGDLRSLYEQWLFWLAAELEQPLWSIGKHRFALPAEYRTEDMRRVAAYEWGKASAVLSIHITGPFLVGDRFTVADIVATHTLLWADHFELPLDGTLRSYLELHTARNAFERTFSYP